MRPESLVVPPSSTMCLHVQFYGVVVDACDGDVDDVSTGLTVISHITFAPASGSRSYGQDTDSGLLPAASHFFCLILIGDVFLGYGSRRIRTSPVPATNTVNAQR